jgi:hypothetical protein
VVLAIFGVGETLLAEFDVERIFTADHDGDDDAFRVRCWFLNVPFDRVFLAAG